MIIPAAKYFVVGILGTVTHLSLLYFAVEFLHMPPLLGSSAAFVVVVVQSYLLNRNWTFGHGGHAPKAFLNYIVLYALGYLINFVVLYVLVDRAEYDHRIVQGAMLLILAVIFFLMQKFLVFRRA